MRCKTFGLIIHCFIVGLCLLKAQNPQDMPKWQLTQQYTPADAGNGNLFGNAVDIDGDYAIASAHRHSPIVNGDTLTQSGAAYIYEKDANGQWNEVQKLTAPDAISFDYFAFDVGISGTTAAIGAHYNSSDANNQNPMPASGAVYIFERNESGVWEFWQKLIASDRDTLDWFGQSLSIHQNRLIVGAPGEDEDAEGNNHLQAAGSAYIFEKDNNGFWVEQQKIVPDFREAKAQFGLQVKIFNDNVVVRHFRYTDLVEYFVNFEFGLSTFSFVDNQWNYTQLFKAERNYFTAFDINDSYLAYYNSWAKTYFIEGINFLQVETAVIAYQKNDDHNWDYVNTLPPSAPRTGFGSALSINKNNEIFTKERGINVGEKGDTIEGDWLQYYALDSTSKSWNIEEQFFIDDIYVNKIVYSENEAIISLGLEWMDPRVSKVLFIQKDLPVSIFNFSSQVNRINIYPNPFKQYFYLELPNGAKEDNITIYNVSMQKIPFSYDREFNKLKMEISQSGQLFYLKYQELNGGVSIQPIIKY